VADDMAVGRCGGGREGRGEGRRRRRGLPFVAASLHLLGSIHGPDLGLMSTHASVLVDSVGPPSAEVCRAAASFP
jgi:hypothetical protein